MIMQLPYIEDCFISSIISYYWKVQWKKNYNFEKKCQNNRCNDEERYDAGRQHTIYIKKPYLADDKVKIVLRRSTKHNCGMYLRPWKPLQITMLNNRSILTDCKGKRVIK